MEIKGSLHAAASWNQQVPIVRVCSRLRVQTGIVVAPPPPSEDVRAAFKTWSRTTPGERSAKLLAIADAVEKNQEPLVALNCGKPINEVRNEEIPTVADFFRYFAGAVRNMPDPPHSFNRVALG